MPPIFSIVIVNWNTRDLLLKCIETLLATEAPEKEIVVVDNASQDDSVAAVQARFPQVRIIQNKDNAGFARGNNIGVAACNTPYALLLNTDAFPQAGALDELLRVMSTTAKAGIVGAHLLNADGSFQASHTPFPTLWREFLILSGLGRLFFGRHYPSAGPDEAKGAQAVDYVEGACLLVNVDVYRAIGGFDEAFFMYSEEVDLCFRMKQSGWQVWYVPEARATHLGSASSKDRKPEREGDLYRSRVRFFHKHYGRGASQLLKIMIYTFALVKIITHGTARLLSGGRFGRPVVSLSYLSHQLSDV
jgi:N-acetylglucosaminyl-diphospho-decaprenol L-rhamnosyltransferase